MKPRFDYEVIRSLKDRVATFNEGVGEGDKTRLQELKKIYERGYRGQNPEQAAMEAVESHLLRKAGDFQEFEHRRDRNGRFASKGVTQRAQYSDVRTSRQHSQLKSVNAGYQAKQTDVIPETRFSSVLPIAVGGTIGAAAAVGGAFPHGRDVVADASIDMSEKLSRFLGDTTGRVVSGAVIGTVRGGQAAARRFNVNLGNISPETSEKVILTVGKLTGKAAGQAGKGAMWLLNKPATWVNRELVDAALGGQPKGKSFSAARRRFGAQVKARTLGAAFGVAANAPIIWAGYHGAGFVGPVLDSWYPRKVEKQFRTPEVEEVLAKVASGASEEELTKINFGRAARRVGAAMGVWGPKDAKSFLSSKNLFAARQNAINAFRAMKPSELPTKLSHSTGAKYGLPGSDEAKLVAGNSENTTLLGMARKHGIGAANRLADRVARFQSRPVFSGASQVLGTMAGAAAGGGIGYGVHQGNPYRDEHGRFTSKERAAMTIGGGALAGAVAALGSMRYANAKAARTIADRIRGSVGDNAARQIGRDEVDAIRNTGEAGKKWEEYLKSRGYAESVDGKVRGSFLEANKAKINELRQKVADKEARAIAAHEKKFADPAGFMVADVDRRLHNKLEAELTSDAFLNMHPESKDKILSFMQRFDKGTYKTEDYAGFGGRKSMLTGEETELHNLLSDEQKKLVNNWRSAANSTKNQIKTLFGEAEDKFKVLSDRHSKLSEAVQQKRERLNWIDDQLDAKYQDGQRVAPPVAGNSKEGLKLNRERKALKDQLAAEEKDLNTVAEQQKLAWESTRTRAGINANAQFKVSDPFGGGFIKTFPTDAEIKLARSKIVQDHTEAFEQSVKNAQKAASRFAKERLSEVSDHFKPHLSALNRGIASFADTVSGTTSRFIADAQNDLSRASRALGGGSSFKSTARRAWETGKSGMEALRDAKAWIMGSGLVGGGALGVAELANIISNRGGRISLNSPDKFGLSAPDGYFEYHHDTDPSKSAAITGAIYTSADGRKRFLFGEVQTRGKNAQPIEIEPGTLVEDIERQWLRGHKGNDGKGDRVQIGYSDEERKKIGRAMNDIKRGPTQGDQEFTVQHRLGDAGQHKDTINIIRNKLRTEAEKAGDINEKLRIIIGGHGADLLDARERASLLIGNEKFPGGVFGKGAFDALEARDWSKVGNIVANTPGINGRLGLKALNVIYSSRFRDKEAWNSAFQTAKSKMLGGGSNASTPTPVSHSTSAAAPKEESFRMPRDPNQWRPQNDDWVPNEIWSSIHNDYKNKVEANSQYAVTHKGLAGTIRSTIRANYNAVSRHKDWQDKSFVERWIEAGRRSRSILQLLDEPPFERSDWGGDLAKYYDESKHSRAPRGSDRGGEFTSKGGAPTSRPVADDRSFFEPVRLAGTLGNYAGMQVAFDLAEKLLPPGVSIPAKIGLFGAKMAASILGGAVGQMGGEVAAQAGYRAVGKRPPKPYEEPDRPVGETLARTGGNLLGYMVGSRFGGSYGAKLASGIIGSLAAEELAGAVHGHILSRYDAGTAARVKAALAH